MKVVLAGDWHSDLHEEVAAEALESLGCFVTRFRWHGYFRSTKGRGSIHDIALRMQNKFMAGPAVWRLNRDLLHTVAHVRPDIVFIYRGSHIFPATLRRMRRLSPDSAIIGYNNDDPFSPLYPGWIWRHYIGGLADYDLVLAYRPKNLDELRRAGARRVELLRSWFVPDRNHPVALSDTQQKTFGCDVVFIGHFEDDDRLSYLEEVVRRGHRLRLFGHPEQWNERLRRSDLLADLAPVRTVWGEEYNLALNGAHVALCFFSRLNRDGYTRRCFEIPASGTILMSEHSDDLASLYNDGTEVILFRNLTEFGQKLDAILADERGLAEMASAGRHRVIADRHDVRSRMEEVLRHVASLRGKTFIDAEPHEVEPE